MTFGIKSSVLLAVLVACLFGFALPQHNDAAREWAEVFWRLSWMALSCLGLWCAAFLWLSRRRMDWILVSLMILAVARLIFGETSRPAGALVLFFSVMLGKGARWTLTFGNPGEDKTVLAGLVWLLAFSSWWHLDMTDNYYHGSRWMGFWDNPNTYGVLMGAGVTLAAGLLRDHARINSVIMAQEFCPLARRKRRAYPASGSVRSEQRSQRSKDQARIAEVVFARSLRLKPKGQRLKPGCETLWHWGTAHGQSAILLVATGMMAVGLLFSYSRGAWLGTTAGLLYLAKSYGKLKWRWVLPGISVVAAMVCVFWHSTPDAGPWYLKRLDFSRPSAQHRVAAWNAAIHIICDHPLGVGWGRAVNVYEEKYSPPEGGAGAITTNDYLMLASELGLPGLLCFVTYVGLCFQAGRFTPRALSSPGKPTSPFIPHSSLQAACRSAALSMAVAFWFDGGLFKLPTAAVFWILLEIGTPAGNGEQKGHQATKPQLLTG
jgi:hypothetical protein